MCHCSRRSVFLEALSQRPGVRAGALPGTTTTSADTGTSRGEAAKQRDGARGWRAAVGGSQRRRDAGFAGETQTDRLLVEFALLEGSAQSGLEEEAVWLSDEESAVGRELSAWSGDRTGSDSSDVPRHGRPTPGLVNRVAPGTCIAITLAVVLVGIFLIRTRIHLFQVQTVNT